MAHEELTGCYVRTVASFGEESPGGRIIIGTLENGMTIKGCAAARKLVSGTSYLFLGQWKTHPKYGRQFCFDSFAKSQPMSRMGIIRYVRGIRGWGNASASVLHASYGADALETVKTDNSLVGDCRYITHEMIADLRKQLGADAQMLYLKTTLMGLFAGKGFPSHTSDWAIGLWGAEAPDLIKANPYILTACKGVGWVSSDRLYCDLGLPLDAIERQGMCLVYTVESGNEGSVWHSVGDAKQTLSQHITGQLKGDAAIEWAVEKGKLAVRESRGLQWLASERLARHEKNVAHLLHEARDEPQNWKVMENIWGTDDEDDGELSTHQVQELRKAAKGKIGILTGFPGTGKTFVLAALIRTLPQGRIAVCAPTGKASSRVTEALRSQEIKGLTATTIHSLLEVRGMEGGIWDFEYDASNSLPFDFIFVDETSMIDLPLWSQLLSARGNAHMMLFGDVQQLSPVGPGAPLRDMIDAGIPCGQLTKVQRNAGQSVRTCQRLVSEGVVEWSDEIDVKNGKNFAHIECSDPVQQVAHLDELIGGRLLAGVDCIWDLQVMVATNNSSAVSRLPLNEHLQALLNPTGVRVNGNPFWIGDKIICLENGYYSPPRQKGFAREKGQLKGRTVPGKEVRVSNGEMARVVDVKPALITAQLAGGRLIVIPKGPSTPKNTGCAWNLGYAITVHKSQGSEWEYTAIVIDASFGAMRLCDRHWLMTAFSRHKIWSMTIGKATVAQQMCLQSHLYDRKTFLVESIGYLGMKEMANDWHSKEKPDGEKESGEKDTPDNATILAGDAEPE